LNIIKEFIKKNKKIKKYILGIIGIFKKVYMVFCNKIFGIDNRKALFISFGGKSYSDNPRAISEKLHEMCPDFNIVWLFNNPEEKIRIVPEYVKCVKNNSLDALKELATAKFWIDNFPKPLYVYKGKNQIYIQTWHGDRGFKRILYDAWPEGRRPYPLIERDICNLAVSGSKYGENKFRSAFKYEANILQKGTPRNDILMKNNQIQAKNIKTFLGIGKNIKILLFAPTLRKEAVSEKIEQNVSNIDFEKVINILEEKTSKKWICLSRAHSAVKGLRGIPKTSKFIDVTDYEEMGDLLLISDVLITDYSSSAGDFVLLKRPVILYQPDREEYIKEDRTFYFDIDKSPYLTVSSNEDLYRLVKDIKSKEIKKNCSDILDFYGTYETGKASDYVVEYILKVK
jgi:CDP-glycerol glycerophosphotransferase